MEQYITEIQFDEIGRSGHIPLSTSNAKLHVEVKSYGPTKTLVISPERYLLSTELKYTNAFIEEQIKHISELLRRFKDLLKIKDDNGKLRVGNIDVYIEGNSQILLSKLQDCQENLLKQCSDKVRKILRNNPTGNGNNADEYDVPTPPLHDLSAQMNVGPHPAGHNPLTANTYNLSCCSPLESAFGLHINKLNQIQVEILEAKDLMPFVVGKLEDVYCKVYLRVKNGSMNGRQYHQPKYTYVCSQTLDPVWTGMFFDDILSQP